MRRRNALIGLGTLSVGAAGIIGSGAFTSVDATRSVSVTTSGDSAALLKFTAANTRAEQYVNTGGDTISIDLSDGLNLNATTVFNPLITITNNSDNDIDLGLELKGDDTFSENVEFNLGGGWEPNPVAADGTYSISSGSSKNFGLRFKIPKGADVESVDMDLVITAKGK